MKYPKVGETFYWKNLEGEIFEDVCHKIEEEDNPDLETMFFISVTENGGGSFVTESDILDPDSEEVQEFQDKLVDKNLREVCNYINQEKVKNILINKLTQEYDWLEAQRILNILGNYE